MFLPSADHDVVAMVRNGVAISLRWAVVVALSSAGRARAQAPDTFVADVRGGTT